MARCNKLEEFYTKNMLLAIYCFKILTRDDEVVQLGNVGIFL